MTYAVRMTGTVIRTDGELSIVDGVSGYVRIRDDFREMFIPMIYVKYVERDGVLIYGSYGHRGMPRPMRKGRSQRSLTGTKLH